MLASTRLLVAIGFVAVTAPGALAQSAAPKPFEPVSGQAGKDVVWVPSPPEMVDKMMELGNVTEKDFVIDLGSGDGRNVIAAARRGARARCRIQPRHGGAVAAPGAGSRRRRQGAVRAARHVRIRHLEGDGNGAVPAAGEHEPAGAEILQPRAGIAHRGQHFRHRRPDERETLPAASQCESWCEVLLWIVPAKVAGTWSTPAGPMTLTQEYQMVQGTITIDGQQHQVQEGRLRGEDLTFRVNDVRYKARVSGKAMAGTLTTPKGELPWTATRQ
jgi:hypothetical protein